MSHSRKLRRAAERRQQKLTRQIWANELLLKDHAGLQAENDRLEVERKAVLSQIAIEAEKGNTSDLARLHREFAANMKQTAAVSEAIAAWYERVG